jgi:hypothetical protein
MKLYELLDRLKDFNDTDDVVIEIFPKRPRKFNFVVRLKETKGHGAIRYIALEATSVNKLKE